MKNTKRIIICAAAVVLGVGVTAAAAAQTTGASEPMASDNASEMSSSESFDTEISEPGKPIEESVSEAENVSGDEEEKMTSSDKQYIPTLNAPDDIDYCDVNDFLPSDNRGGAIVVYTEPRSEVYAVSGGEVIFADYDIGGGNTIIIKYENGFYGSYFHFDFDGGMLVAKGDIVEAGQLIGLTGTSGAATEACLGYLCRDALSLSFLARCSEISEF